MSVYVEFRPNWVNGGWLKFFTLPFVQVDGREYPCDWKRPTILEVEPGPHLFRTFVRYKKLIPGEGGAAERQIDIPVGGVRIVASNSWTNGSPFVPRVVERVPT